MNYLETGVGSVLIRCIRTDVAIFLPGYRIFKSLLVCTSRAHFTPCCNAVRRHKRAFRFLLVLAFTGLSTACAVKPDALHLFADTGIESPGSTTGTQFQGGYSSQHNCAACSDHSCGSGHGADQATLKSLLLYGFDLEEASLRPQMKVRLKEYAHNLMAEGPIQKITIVGYTDQAGSDRFNQALSERRAESVAIYLKWLGVFNTNIIIEGRGEHFGSHQASTQARNSNFRRVEVFAESAHHSKHNSYKVCKHGK